MCSDLGCVVLCLCVVLLPKMHSVEGFVVLCLCCSANYQKCIVLISNCCVVFVL